MKKIFCFLIFLSSLYADNSEEIYNKRIYFYKPVEEIKNEIVYYESELEKIENPQYYLVLSILYNALGRNLLEEKGYGHKSKENIDKYLTFEKENAIVLSQRATANAFMAKDNWNPFSKSKNVNDSIKDFDKAIKLAKDKKEYVEVLYQQSNVYLNIPKKFGKRKEAYRGFEEILEIYKKNEIYFIPEILISLYYYIGQGKVEENKKEEAVLYWEKGKEIIKLYEVNTHEAKLLLKSLNGYIKKSTIVEK